MWHIVLRWLTIYLYLLYFIMLKIFLYYCHCSGESSWFEFSAEIYLLTHSSNSSFGGHVWSKIWFAIYLHGFYLTMACVTSFSKFSYNILELTNLDIHSWKSVISIFPTIFFTMSFIVVMTLVLQVINSLIFLSLSQICGTNGNTLLSLLIPSFNGDCCKIKIREGE